MFSGGRVITSPWSVETWASWRGALWDLLSVMIDHWEAPRGGTPCGTATRLSLRIPPPVISKSNFSVISVIIGIVTYIFVIHCMGLSHPKGDYSTDCECLTK